MSCSDSRRFTVTLALWRKRTTMTTTKTMTTRRDKYNEEASVLVFWGSISTELRGDDDDDFYVFLCPSIQRLIIILFIFWFGFSYSLLLDHREEERHTRERERGEKGEFIAESDELWTSSIFINGSQRLSFFYFLVSLSFSLESFSFIRSLSQ